MCAPSQGVLLPYGLKIPSPYFPFGPGGSLSQVHLSALDFQRSQLNDYNVRVQLGLRNYQNTVGLSPFQAYINDPYTQAYFYKHDPRARFVHEEPKPSHSYIGLIAMAILNSKEKKLVLSDIYQWILDNYPYFRTRGPGWRNSIRHNLSLNDCFIKAGRSANGKGHYWAVHPANVEDFERGDFRRRRAQRKVRRHMGLSVPDDDDSPTPSPTQPWPHHDLEPEHDRGQLHPAMALGEHSIRSYTTDTSAEHLITSHHTPCYGPMPLHPKKPSKRRLFDVASLLAPDDDDEVDTPSAPITYRDPLKSSFLSSYSFYQIPDDVKGDRRTSSGHSKDSNGASMLNDHSRDAASRSSCSGKGDLSYESDDDIDENEIHVTSGENSPVHDMDDDCDLEHSGCSDFLSRERKKSSPEHKDDFLSSGKPLNGAKCDSALDLTSPIPSTTTNDTSDVTYTKYDVTSNSTGGHDNIKNKPDQYSSSQTIADSGFKLDSKLSIDKMLNIDTKLSADRDGHKQMLSTERAECSANSRPSHKDNELKEVTTTTSELTSDGLRLTADNIHFLHSELHELRRQQHFEMTNGLVDSNRNHLDIRRETPEMTSPLTDPARLACSDSIRWAELGKCPVSRDRLSAFSALGVRSHPLYSPFQLRNFPFSQQRLLPMGPPLRPGHPPTVLPTVSQSVPLLKGLENYTNGSIAATSHSTLTTRSGNIRE